MIDVVVTRIADGAIFARRINMRSRGRDTIDPERQIATADEFDPPIRTGEVIGIPDDIDWTA